VLLLVWFTFDLELRYRRCSPQDLESSHESVQPSERWKHFGEGFILLRNSKILPKCLLIRPKIQEMFPQNVSRCARFVVSVERTR